MSLLLLLRPASVASGVVGFGPPPVAHSVASVPVVTPTAHRPTVRPVNPRPRR
jgi:hypothetical protein